MPTLRTLRNKADAQARALGHFSMRFSTAHSHAMWGTCKDCGAWVSVRNDSDGAPISGLAIRETCAQVKADRPEVRTERKYVAGRLKDCVCLGEWADSTGRRYTAWQSATNSLSAWVRLEPFDGGRARSMYDAGGSVKRQISTDRRRAEEEAQAQTGA